MGKAKKKSKKQAAEPLRAPKARRTRVPDAEAHVKEGKARGRAARKPVPRSSLAYADQNELDYQAMLDAAADGRIEVQPSDR